MTLIETIENNSNTIRKSGIKTVKNAVIYENHNIIYCRHYDTVIFAYDLKNNIAEAQKNLSPTSDRQIRHLCEAFSLDWDDVKNVSQYSKWAFKGSL